MDRARSRPHNRAVREAQTPREALRDLLLEQTCTLREASRALRLSEREVADHLAHLDKSARARGDRLVQDAPRCLACGFVFDARSRAKRPSKCPQCRGGRISQPRFSIEPRP